MIIISQTGRVFSRYEFILESVCVLARTPVCASDYNESRESFLVAQLSVIGGLRANNTIQGEIYLPHSSRGGVRRFAFSHSIGMLSETFQTFRRGDVCTVLVKPDFVITNGI